MEKDLNENIETNEIYLEQIEALKNRIDNEMVDKNELIELKRQHKALLDDYVNRRPVVEVKETKGRPAKDIAADILKAKSGNMSNKDYVALALEYREAFISELGQDPFSNSIVTNKGVQFEKVGENKDAEEVAMGLEYLIGESEDPVSFNIRANNIFQDDNALINKIRKSRNKK